MRGNTIRKDKERGLRHGEMESLLSVLLKYTSLLSRVLNIAKIIQFQNLLCWWMAKTLGNMHDVCACIISEKDKETGP